MGAETAQPNKMDLQAQADAFRAQKPGEDVDPSWDLLTGMKLPKAFETEFAHPQAPVFTHMNDNGFPNLYEDNKMVVYLNNALPYLNAYPGNEGRAAMSFMHLLVAPRERIYNIKTMRGESDRALLKYMKDVVDLAFMLPTFRRKVQYALSNQNFLQAPFSVLTQENRDAYHESKELFQQARSKNLSYWFHEHPNHSVGHLHMHVLLDTALTPAFKIHEHENVPFETALAQIME